MIRQIVTLVLILGCLCKSFAEPPALKFIENKGQWPSTSLFSSEIPGGNVHITKEGFTYFFYDTKKLHDLHHGFDKHNDGLKTISNEGPDDKMIGTHYFKANFINADFSSIEVHQPLKTNFNYYYGSDENKWVSKANGYKSLEVRNIYSGIDLRIKSESYSLKYDLIVSKYANPDLIKVEYDGVEDIYLKNQNLIIKTSVNEITEYKPFAYQVIDGQKIQVVCEYVLKENVLSYDFPLGYDKTRQLIIDPLLIFSTYSGSAADNWGNTATFGENGTLYSGGITSHTRGGTFLGEFPATTGAYQTEYAGFWDVAIIKYDSAGSKVEYATYLGGNNSEVPISMIMNSKQELLIYGVTSSSDFPVRSNAYQTTYQGGEEINTILGETLDGSDTFIAKLSADGSQLTGSTFFGGSGNDGLNESTGLLTRNYGDEQRGEIFIDSDDNVYVTGSSASTDLFTDSSIESFEPNYQGGPTDAFVIKMNSELTNLDWGGYLGGTSTETGLAIKVDSKNDVFVAGGTNSFNFPQVNVNETFHGDIDGWITRISADSIKINKVTFVGTSNYDQTYFLDIDSNDDVYILGQTNGNFPVSGNVYSNTGGGQFIQKYNNDLDNRIFSTVFGTSNRNSPNISPTAFLVNDCNNLYVAGWGNSQPNFTGNNYLPLNTRGLPTTSNALRTETSGDDFYLFVLDANAQELLYATFFGGANALVHVDGGTSRFDKSGIVYHSVCASCAGGSTFPTTDGAWSQDNGANPGCNNAAFKFDLASLRAIIQTNNTALTEPGFNNVCVPDSIVFQNLSFGGEVYEWDLGDGTSLIKNDTSYFSHQYQSQGTYTVTLIARDPNTCIAQDIATTEVTILNPIQRAIEDSDICVGDDFRLSAVGGTSYNWISEDSTLITSQARPLVSPQDTTQYFVEIADQFCSTLDTVVLNVIPRAELMFSMEKIQNCFSRPSLQLTNNSDDVSYTWDLGDGNKSTEKNLTYNYEEDGTYNVKLIGENGKCIFQEEVEVNIASIKIPNVFTPSDGSPNETFEIISPSREILKIFNRWGTLVYESEDYQDDWTGKDVPAGVYFYECEIDNEVTCTGWVQVFK